MKKNRFLLNETALLRIENDRVKKVTLVKIGRFFSTVYDTDSIDKINYTILTSRLIKIDEDTKE